jgi:hypothetical protein
MTRPITIVWLTQQSIGTPHAGHLQAANPEVAILTHHAPEVETPEVRFRAWRNCDRNIREFWRTRRDEVLTDEVLFLEWDVFVNVPVDAVLPPPDPGVGITGAMVGSVVHNRAWTGFAELQRLPRRMWAHAIGMIPSAVLLLRRTALDALADDAWDDLYAADIISELRTGTLLRYLGHGVAACHLWEYVTPPPLRRMIGEMQGICHPVKKPVTPP